MKNEYLFFNSEYQKLVEKYKTDKIKLEVSDIKKNGAWIATYSTQTNNEKDAIELSELHIDIMSLSPQVLSCESSEYFNKTLFPLINRFERKLRKLLYIAASISNDKKAMDSIKNLEKKDLGSLFDLLFIDSQFIISVKGRVNASKGTEFHGKGNYSKEELEEYIACLEEKTLWDSIIGKEYVNTLRYRFREAQEYRNSVMHAHNIDRYQFIKSKRLFTQINKELDEAIEEFNYSDDEKKQDKKVDFNKELSSAMEAMQETNAMKLLNEMQEISAMELLKRDRAIAGMLKELNESSSSYKVQQMLKTNTMELLKRDREFKDMLKELNESSLSYKAEQILEEDPDFSELYQDNYSASKKREDNENEGD